jgi:hypothetical protein
MPTTGLEPVRRFRHWSLKPACLPIPARGHTALMRPSLIRYVCSKRKELLGNGPTMLGEGFEPSQGFPHRILNPARLPVPPPELQGLLKWSRGESNP